MNAIVTVLRQAESLVYDAIDAIRTRTGRQPINRPAGPVSGARTYVKNANPMFIRPEFSTNGRVNLIENAVPNWRAFEFDPFGQTHTHEQLVASGFISPLTGLPTSIPPGSDMVQLAELTYDFVRYTGLPTLVIDTDYDADIVINGAPPGSHTDPELVNGRLRREVTLPDGFGGGGVVALNITAIRAVGTSIRVYWKEYLGTMVDPDANGGWHPGFVAEAAENNVLRYLDHLSLNQHDGITVDDVPGPEYHGYGAFKIGTAGAVKMGVPPELFAKLCGAAGTGGWWHMLGRLGHTARHDDVNNLQNFPQDNLTFAQYLRDDAANIIASNQWELWVKRVYDAIRSDPVAATKTHYWEHKNETWNFLNGDFIPNSYGDQAIAEAVNPAWVADDVNHFIQLPYNRQGTGYMLARAMDEWDRLQALNDTDIDMRFILPCWTAVPVSMQESIDGFNYYWTQNAIDPAPKRARLQGSKAGYYSGVMRESDINENPQTPPLLVITGYASFDALRDAHIAGQITTDAINDAFNEFYLSETEQFSNVEWTIARGREIKAICDNNGLGTAYGLSMAADYEAGTHENRGANWTGGDAQQYLYNLYHQSPQAAAMQRAYADRHLDEFGEQYMVTMFSIGAGTDIGFGTGGQPGANPWFRGSIWEPDAPLRQSWLTLPKRMGL